MICIDVSKLGESAKWAHASGYAAYTQPALDQSGDMVFVGAEASDGGTSGTLYAKNTDATTGLSALDDNCPVDRDIPPCAARVGDKTGVVIVTKPLVNDQGDEQHELRLYMAPG